MNWKLKGSLPHEYGSSPFEIIINPAAESAKLRQASNGHGLTDAAEILIRKC